MRIAITIWPAPTYLYPFAPLACDSAAALVRLGGPYPEERPDVERISKAPKIPEDGLGIWNTVSSPSEIVPLIEKPARTA